MDIRTKQRFWSKVALRQFGCWDWQACTRGGYGRFSLHGANTLAHRFAYQEVHGTIPEGQELDHLCQNKACVNPVHLQAVPHRVNILRGGNFAAIKAAQTHCKRGHEFTTSNTIFRREYRNRECRQCKADYMRDRRNRKRSNET